MALLTSAESWRGSGASFVQIYGHLRARGHTPHLFTVAPAVTRRFEEAGASVTQLRARSRTGAMRELRAHLRRHGARVLIADMPRDLRMGAVATARTRTRLVYRYNRNSAPPTTDLLVRLAYRWAVRETVFLTADGHAPVLALAPFMRRVPTRAIPNGIDPHAFTPDPAGGAAYRRAHGLGDRPLVLAVGALSRQKRYDVLIDAVARLPAPRPALHVCGGGPLEAELVALAAERGVELRLVGELAPAALAEAYAAATVFVHCCVGETFGRAIAEAMTCGCAVVAPDSGSAPEVVGRDGSAGVLVPPLDPAAVAAAVAALLDDPTRRARLGRAARARIVEHFSLDAMAAGYDRLVRDVAAG